MEQVGIALAHRQGAPGGGHGVVGQVPGLVQGALLQARHGQGDAGVRLQDGRFEPPGGGQAIGPGRLPAARW